jgi:GNAT superfamily N-acetyltransferase
MSFAVRLATPADVPVLSALIEASVRELQAADYSPTQLDAALSSVFGVDSQLIADGTYFVVEVEGPEPVIVGCGGWSRRKTLYGGDRFAVREDSLLDPARDPARIRAFFVHPTWARRGIGALMLDTCERAAASEGFTRLEMGATLTGVPFYRAKGYAALEDLTVGLPGGQSLPIVRMGKSIGAGKSDS